MLHYSIIYQDIIIIDLYGIICKRQSVATMQKEGNRRYIIDLVVLQGFTADMPALLRWLDSGDNRLYCDTIGALGGTHLMQHPKVRCMNVSTGRTQQAFIRLSEKVLANIRNFLN